MRLSHPFPSADEPSRAGAPGDGPNLDDLASRGTPASLTAAQPSTDTTALDGGGLPDPCPDPPSASPDALLDVVGDVVFAADARGRWTYLNAAWQRLTGHDDETSLGRSLCAFVHPGDHAALAEALRALAEGRHASFRYEARFVCADGQTCRMEMHARATCDDLGELTGFAGTLREVGVRHDREVALEHARNDAQQAAEHRARFVSHLSHELRTPLTSIIGFAELLEREPPDDLTTYLEYIRLNGERLSETLDSVLMLSRLDAGMVEVEPERVCVAQEVRDTVKLFLPTAQEQGVALGASVSARSRVMATTDPALVRRILTNLVSNALKYTDAGGSAEIGLGETHDAAMGDVVVLTVSDTGRGIDPAFLPRLFEPFTRAQKADDAATRSSGLGLAITRSLVRRLGGRIEVESTPGEGTTFTVILPRG
jgi:PAS domain S-box-containing protein